MWIATGGWISRRGTTDVTASQLACVDLFLKLEGLSSDRSASSSVKLTDSALKGQLSLWTGDGSVKLDLARITADGPAEVHTGSRDDYLRIVNSVFADSVLLDGGAGKDTLQLSGNQFATEPTLLNWETVKR